LFDFLPKFNSASEEYIFFIGPKSDAEQSVIQVVQAILNLPEQVHIAVRCTGIKLIGELCEWLNRHPQFIGIGLFFIYF